MLVSRTGKFNWVYILRKKKSSFLHNLYLKIWMNVIKNVKSLKWWLLVKGLERKATKSNKCRATNVRQMNVLVVEVYKLFSLFLFSSSLSTDGLIHIAGSAFTPQHQSCFDTLNTFPAPVRAFVDEVIRVLRFCLFFCLQLKWWRGWGAGSS